jgi:hypothetical protein
MNSSFVELQTRFDEFEDARAGLPLAPERPTMWECYIGATEEEAFDDVRNILYAKYNAYQSWAWCRAARKLVGSTNLMAACRLNFGWR